MDVSEAFRSSTLSDDMYNFIKMVASRDGITPSEVLKRALAIYEFVQQDLQDKNKKLQIVEETENDTRTVREMVFS